MICMPDTPGERKEVVLRQLQTAHILCHDKHMTYLVFIKKKTASHLMKIKESMTLLNKL